MIINGSRAQVFLTCKRKAFDQFYRRLQSREKSMNLVDGGAFHAGVAAGLASKDWEQARKLAHEEFRKRDRGVEITLPGEEFLEEDHLDLVDAMLDCYRENYEEVEYQVIQPECSFDVELPDSKHHCLFIHHGLPRGSRSDPPVYSEEFIDYYNGPPREEDVLGGKVMRCPCPACFVPHRLVGKTDAVVMWTFGGSRGLWLLEHKTTAVMGPQFWDQFLLDIQPTIYLYGIWKSLGIRPAGVVVNGIWKPSESQVAAWNKKRKSGQSSKPRDYIKYERQPFVRTLEDLERLEKQMIDICDEWEIRMLMGKWPMSNVRTTCISYNRKCDFHGLCMSHDQPELIQLMARRPLDYVDEKQQQQQEKT